MRQDSNTVSKPLAMAKKLWSCEQGAEGLEKLLIIGAVVLPLLGLLMLFREQISEFVSSKWSDVQNDDYDPTDYAGN